jgi:hypothetical protein
MVSAALLAIVVSLALAALVSVAIWGWLHHVPDHERLGYHVCVEGNLTACQAKAERGDLRAQYELGLMGLPVRSP